MLSTSGVGAVVLGLVAWGIGFIVLLIDIPWERIADNPQLLAYVPGFAFAIPGLCGALGAFLILYGALVNVIADSHNQIISRIEGGDGAGASEVPSARAQDDVDDPGLRAARAVRKRKI